MKTLKTIIFAVAILSSITANAWEGKNWLSNVPDSAYVCSLSIPGSHDSCTEGVSYLLSDWAQTQTLTLEEQFKKGVRVFDIRPALDFKSATLTFLGSYLGIFHGIVYCGITFDEVIDTFKSLLNSNSSEFIIMIVNVEDNKVFTTDASREAVGEKERAFIGDRHFVQEFRPDLTVGEMRGKILIINRDSQGEITNPPLPAAFFNGWGSKPSTGSITFGARASAGGMNAAKMYDQDVDNYEHDYDWETEKFQYFKQTADAYYAEKDYFTWCFNCTSGWCGESFATMDYNENADKVNGYVSGTYIPNEEKFHVRGAWRGVGIILMDYAGCDSFRGHNTYGNDMIREIINLNFK